ncbi:hypothetical protein [Paenibacillus oryzisoli]|uniref:Portal protein n=1 Tax=Paenibacillus oryzisoli TaxID=1850517 RepID=A0A198ADX0_9BACL|nr:hypothetical protein [Paenibacillus oryzisoli]OAS19251.1 hypothetical protein A8708_26430 [Paenibacillus oryzisoli]
MKGKVKEKDSATFVKEKSDEGTSWAVIRQIQINRAFFRGFQWISWDKNNRRVFVPDLRPGEKRYTYNKIKPAVLTLQAKLCKNRVQLEVSPDTDDDERIETARGAQKFLKYQWNDDSMDHKSRRLRFHMLVDGFPALKVYVDKTKGDDLSIDPEMIQELDEEMDQKSIPMKTGKIVTQVVDQLALKVDPTAEDIEEIKWAMEERPMDVEEIAEIWGKEVEPDGEIALRQTFDQLSGSESAVKKYKNMAIVYDYWELPCARYPKGLRIVVSGGTELEKSTDPGEFPFVFFPAVPVPGRAISDGIVNDLTTPQKSYNIKRTAEARILEEMGNPMWTIPLGTLEDEDEISNEIGGIIHYTPNTGSKPERVQGASVDAGWQNAMERDEADMEDISGAHEISQGSTPKGNNTLGGLQLQVEQDETKLALLVQSYEDGIKKWGEKVLRLVQKHFPEEQQLSIVGENGEVEAFSFSGADLENGWVVDVVPGSSMPTLKAVEDQKVMSMWGAGMFINPNTGQPDTRRVVRMLGESIANSYFDDTLQDENKARFENRTWQKTFADPNLANALMKYSRDMEVYKVGVEMSQQKGVTPEELGFPRPQLPAKLPIVRDFYDHQTHIEQHNRFRKTDDYDNLPPEFQQLIDQHVQEHIQFMQAPQEAAQQQALEAQQQQAEADKALKVQSNQMQEKKLQLDAVKTAAEMQRTQAQLQHEKELKGMDQQHDMSKTLIQYQANKNATSQ